LEVNEIRLQAEDRCATTPDRTASMQNPEPADPIEQRQADTQQRHGIGRAAR
jgi:hypothetical protein